MSEIIKHEDLALPAIVQEVTNAKASPKIGEVADDVLNKLIRLEISKAISRIGWKAVEQSVFEVAAEDLAYLLKSKYRHLGIQEVGIAFRTQALNDDKSIFCSQTLAKWLQAYLSEVRPMAFRAREVRKELPHISDEEAVNDAFARYIQVKPIYNHKHIYEILDRKGVFKLSKEEKWEAVRNAIDWEIADLAIRMRDPKLRDIAKQREKSFLIARKDLSKADQIVKDAGMRWLVNEYFCEMRASGHKKIFE